MTGIILSSYCIIYNLHGNAVWHHVRFGHGNNRKKEFRNDARLKTEVGLNVRRRSA
jgi:hypothetical protein